MREVSKAWNETFICQIARDMTLPDLHSKNLLLGNPLHCTHFSKDYANIQVCRNICTNAFEASSAHTGIRIKWVKTYGGEWSYLNGRIMENTSSIIILLL